MTDPTLLVLASLAEGDKHGHAIMLDVKTFAGVKLGPGTLYGAITRLDQRGWIKPVESRTSVRQDRRQPYRITSAGREHLTAQLTQLKILVKAGFGRLREA